MAKNKSTKEFLIQFPPPPAVKNEIKDLKTKLIGFINEYEERAHLVPEAEVSRGRSKQE